MSENYNNPGMGAAQTSLKCKNCGGNLIYKPGVKGLVCAYCGTVNETSKLSSSEIFEFNYTGFVHDNTTGDNKPDVSIVKCTNCGTVSPVKPNTTDARCPKCSAVLPMQEAITPDVNKPLYILPFLVDRKTAAAKFEEWVKGLDFVPEQLKKYSADYASNINCVYVPFWVFSFDASTDYSAERATTVGISKKSGTISSRFNNLLVPANGSIPPGVLADIANWDMADLVFFEDVYTKDIKTENSSLGLQEGFIKAKGISLNSIKRDIAKDAGLGIQEVNSTNVTYSNVKFKKVLLPIWISTYIYNKYSLNFVVNGSTGTMSGETPVKVKKRSPIKPLGYVGLFFLAVVIFNIIRVVRETANKSSDVKETVSAGSGPVTPALRDSIQQKRQPAGKRDSLTVKGNRNSTNK